VNVISLQISDDTGRSNESDVVSAMQWVYDNHTAYNIRVVNLSLNSSVMQSYHNSPLCAAAEVLWMNGILVVAAAGNSGVSGLYPPGNDPFVITVGAVDDRGTPGLDDDAIAAFSAYGKTELNTVKPELVAPGVNLIAYMPDHHSLAISRDHPENRVSEDYFRMSGTSVAAALVSGAAALLFEASPHLSADQAKYLLMASANQSWTGYHPKQAGAGYLDAYAAVKSTDAQNANEGLLASQLLWDGNDPLLWGNVAWGSVSWGSVAWGSVAWGSVAWGSDYWGD
jgi:serine protease AprX